MSQSSAPQDGASGKPQPSTIASLRRENALLRAEVERLKAVEFDYGMKILMWMPWAWVM